MWEIQIRSWSLKDPLEKEMATHSSILAWKIPQTEEPGKAPIHVVAKSQTCLSDSHTNLNKAFKGGGHLLAC